MDPDLIRLILVVLGVLLVAGIYLWDRFKRAAPRALRGRRAPLMSTPTADMTDQASPDGRAQPTIDELPETIPSMRIEDMAEQAAAHPTQRAAALDPEPAELGDWPTTRRDVAAQVAMDLSFDAHGDSDYLSGDPTLHDEVERKIIVINLVARDGEFTGPAIERACAATDLVRGEMSIFHRHEADRGRVLFSMASMVEPGSFPADDMQDFRTPGLSLFTQLPGVRDGLEIYDQMLATASRLAALLNAEVQDERHNRLTKQMEKHTRDAIVEHRRKIRLARSRR